MKIISGNLSALLSSFKFPINIIKLHPHVKNKDVNALEFKDFDLSVAADLPAEILILNLINISKKIFIISEFSTATIYFQSISNVEIINIPFSEEEIYDNNDSYLDAYNNLNAHINLIN